MNTNLRSTQAVIDYANKTGDSGFHIKSKTVLYDKQNNSYDIRSSFIPFWMLRCYVKIVSVVPFLTTYKNKLNLMVKQAKDATLNFKGFTNKNYIDLLSLKDRKISAVKIPKNNLKVSNTNNTSSKNTTITIYQDTDETKKDTNATKEAQKMLQGLLNDGVLWVASDQDRIDYQENFQDILGDSIDDVKNDQLIAYQYGDGVYLTPLISLVNSLNTNKKFDHIDPDSQNTITVFSVNNVQEVVCNNPTAIAEGKCPKGRMSVKFIKREVKGYDCKGVFEIEYTIPKGKQGKEHPSPGVEYLFSPNPRTCYLPANTQGVKILIMQMQAWENRLTFDVGTSSSTGKDNRVIWNFHQKTQNKGHRLEDDPGYLNTAATELYKEHITQDSIKKMQFLHKKRSTDYGMQIQMDSTTYKAIVRYQKKYQ
jgi:deltex-like protein